MQDIEPYFHWRNDYIAAEDKASPFYNRFNDEFNYTHQIYNYVIHPQWDNIGSPTLYIKVIFADYDEGYAIIDFIGEWNDCITNDIMFLKREMADYYMDQGISKFILIGENILNFHASDDDDYYAEWLEEVNENQGYIVIINMLDHVLKEMKDNRLHHFMLMDGPYNNIVWRGGKPSLLAKKIEQIIEMAPKLLTDGHY